MHITGKHLPFVHGLSVFITERYKDNAVAKIKVTKQGEIIKNIYESSPSGNLFQ